MYLTVGDFPYTRCVLLVGSFSLRNSILILVLSNPESEYDILEPPRCYITCLKLRKQQTQHHSHNTHTTNTLTAYPHTPKLIHARNHNHTLLSSNFSLQHINITFPPSITSRVLNSSIPTVTPLKGVLNRHAH